MQALLMHTAGNSRICTSRFATTSVTGCFQPAAVKLNKVGGTVCVAAHSSDRGTEFSQTAILRELLRDRAPPNDSAESSATIQHLCGEMHACEHSN